VPSDADQIAGAADRGVRGLPLIRASRLGAARRECRARPPARLPRRRRGLVPGRRAGRSRPATLRSCRRGSTRTHRTTTDWLTSGSCSSARAGGGPDWPRSSTRRRCARPAPAGSLRCVFSLLPPRPGPGGSTSARAGRPPESRSTTRTSACRWLSTAARSAVGCGRSGQAAGVSRARRAGGASAAPVAAAAASRM
jgi:hypothetical protein